MISFERVLGVIEPHFLKINGFLGIRFYEFELAQNDQLTGKEPMRKTLGRGTEKMKLLERYGAQLGAIVERRRAELALTAAKQEAERSALLARDAMTEAQTANRAKTEFLANMSHELRTPLNAIIGFSEMMIKGLLAPDRTEKHLEYAHGINEAGQHLLELISDILDLAKVEAGRLELEEQVVDFNKILSSCLLLVKERASEAELSLCCEIPKNLPWLFIDERKIKQVLINLLSNAIKFTPKGGTITLKVGPAEDGGFMFTLTDTGIGIADKDVWKALAPFTQVDRDIDCAYEGTGLGLPLSKALIELHEGKLSIQSKVGTGTRVTVRLPLARIRKPAQKGIAGAAAAAMQKPESLRQIGVQR